MISDKRTAYVLSLAFLAILSVYFFVPIANNALLLAIIVLLFAVLSVLLIKKRSALSVFKGQVLLLMSVIALVYAMLYYLTGLHFGFFRRAGYSFFKVIGEFLPTAVVFASCEVIRKAFCAQKYKAPKIIVFFGLVFAEILLTYSFSRLTNFNRFMDFMGMSLFPAIVGNLLFHYLSSSYGMFPNLVYRILTSLLLVVIPYGSRVPDSLFSLFKLIFPLLVYFFIKVLYEKKKREKKKVAKGVSIAIFGVVLAVLIGLIMLVSCQFKYCALVIATDSMTGELNKGDVTIYKKYDGEPIDNGQIIVFDKGDGTTVHRVVNIEVVNGTIRYTTKGDANDDVDFGYVYSGDIKGTTLFKVAYFGYPTLWLRALFK